MIAQFQLFCCSEVVNIIAVAAQILQSAKQSKAWMIQYLKMLPVTGFAPQLLVQYLGVIYFILVFSGVLFLDELCKVRQPYSTGGNWGENTCHRRSLDLFIVVDKRLVISTTTGIHFLK